MPTRTVPGSARDTELLRQFGSNRGAAPDDVEPIVAAFQPDGGWPSAAAPLSGGVGGQRHLEGVGNREQMLGCPFFEPERPAHEGDDGR